MYKNEVEKNSFNIKFNVQTGFKNNILYQYI